MRSPSLWRWPVRRPRAPQRRELTPGRARACPWVDSQAPISARVADVIDHMSLGDEITMVEGHGTAPPNPYVFYMPGIPDLCIPQLGEEDGPGGVADELTNVTQLPAGVGLAATFNPSLARQYGQVIGNEELGKGAAVNLGPTVNIDRDPRWGRSFETFTEDPFLNSALTVSEIKGVQSTGEMSQVKHFAAYNQETNRNTPQDDVIALHARAARDLRAGLPGGGGERQRRLRDVLLLDDQRQLRLPEQHAAQQHAQAAVGLPGLRHL